MQLQIKRSAQMIVGLSVTWNWEMSKLLCFDSIGGRAICCRSSYCGSVIRRRRLALRPTPPPPTSTSPSSRDGAPTAPHPHSPTSPSSRAGEATVSAG